MSFENSQAAADAAFIKKVVESNFLRLIAFNRWLALAVFVILVAAPTILIYRWLNPNDSTAVKEVKVWQQQQEQMLRKIDTMQQALRVRDTLAYLKTLEAETALRAYTTASDERAQQRQQTQSQITQTYTRDIAPYTSGVADKQLIRREQARLLAKLDSLTH